MVIFFLASCTVCITDLHSFVPFSLSFISIYSCFHLPILPLFLILLLYSTDIGSEGDSFVWVNLWSTTELASFLTYFFSFKSRQQCFSDASTRRPSDLLSSYTTIKTVMNTLYDGLSEVLRNLLRSTDTRENVLEYLAEVINLNASRAHIQVNFFLICIVKNNEAWRNE